MRCNRGTSHVRGVTRRMTFPQCLQQYPFCTFKPFWQPCNEEWWHPPTWKRKEERVDIKTKKRKEVAHCLRAKFPLAETHTGEECGMANGFEIGCRKCLSILSSAELFIPITRAVSTQVTDGPSDSESWRHVGYHLRAQTFQQLPKNPAWCGTLFKSSMWSFKAKDIAVLKTNWSKQCVSSVTEGFRRERALKPWRQRSREGGKWTTPLARHTGFPVP